MTDLLDLYQFEFFRNGVIAATLAGALCGFVGVYVVLRNMSYIGHGMSHAIFGGFAASALLGVNYFLGAGAWGLASALAIATITRRRGLGSDAVIGVITTASFAIGLILGDLFHGPKQNFDAALFGKTSVTSTPATLPEEEAVARSGVNVWIETPSKPRSVVFDTRSRITLRASLVGIANPSPIDPFSLPTV